MFGECIMCKHHLQCGDSELAMSKEVKNKAKEFKRLKEKFPTLLMEDDLERLDEERFFGVICEYARFIQMCHQNFEKDIENGKVISANYKICGFEPDKFDDSYYAVMAYINKNAELENREFYDNV